MSFESIQNLMSAESGNSFTALLELPPNQAMKLLHSPEETTPNVFPENSTNSIPPNCELMKQEPIESPIFSDPVVVPKSSKHREKKVKSMKTETNYVHVRARRGEATDSHSLAERARRDKINARMKLLQELLPACNKIAGTAMVLDEIINHVQSLQLHIEFLSMKLASVHPTIGINLDNFFPSENGSPMDSNFAGPPLWWLDGQDNGNIWHPDNMVTPENSLLSYNSSANSASWHLKTEI